MTRQTSIHPGIVNKQEPVVKLLILALSMCAITGFSQITQTFNSNGTFVVPPTINTVTVECWGAGGSGSGSAGDSNEGGGGGGGGAYSRSTISVVPGSSQTVTVGLGGAGLPGAGIPGGDSWFGSASTVMAKGGGPGLPPPAGGMGGTPGLAVPGFGSIRYDGGAGGNGWNGGGMDGSGGGGGSSAGTASFGFPGQNGNTSPCCPAQGGFAPTGGGNGGNAPYQANGISGIAPGGGGGGGSGTGGGQGIGGSGANGRVVVSYFPASNNSNIEATGFIPTTNIDYRNYQYSSTFPVGVAPPATTIKVAEFNLKDGGPTATDTDLMGTTLTGITFNVTNPDNLRYIGITNGSNVAASQLVSGSTVTLSGLSITAQDASFGSAVVPLQIFVSFKSTVTDNQHFEMQITGVTSAPAGSAFAQPNGGGSQSSTNPLDNKVVVTATQLGFVQQPTNTMLNVAMAPVVSVEARDNLGSRDLDIPGTVGVTSTGTLSGAPTATLAAGFGAYSAITHTATATGRTLTTTNALGLTNATSTTFSVSTSNSSDIIDNAGFAYNSNIAYGSYQEAVNIQATASSLVVAKFDLRDGGGGADADVAATTLTALTFNLGSAFSNIRRIALYDAAGTTEITGTEQAVSSSMVNFSGFTISAPDGTTPTTFSVRVSFNTVVTDNQSISFAITSAFTQPGSSTFPSPSAGGASSSTSGDNNRLEVTATKLVFTTNLNANLVSLINISTQQSAPVIKAQDANNNTDADYVTNVTLSAAVTLSTSTISTVAGVATFPGTFQFTQSGVGTLTANSGGLTAATSAAVAVHPTIQPATPGTHNSFTANWLASPGATNYRLDVSVASNFSSFVGTYNNFSTGNVLFASVNSGLTGNTLYYYRIRTEAGGTSGNSASASITTAPNPPAPTVNNVTDVSFSVNWAGMAGATDYFLDVSTVSNFASFVPGYNNLDVNGVSTFAVNTGLAANTPYYIRMRSQGANGTSGSSTTATVTTAPAAPSAPTADNVFNNAFRVNWSTSTAATGYFLDVSTVSNFSSFVTGYNNLSVGNVTNFVVNTGLTASTLYYMRVRASNGNGASNSSLNGSVTTGPPPPASASASNIGSANFTANWSASSGATGYALDVSSDNFSSFVTGYNGKAVASTSDLVSPLQPNTNYQFRVRATNSNGSSVSSSTATALTLPAAPTGIAATLISQTGFTANWNTMAGITNFKLDVSTDNFVTRIPGYDDLSVTGTSQVVTGLVAGTTYAYRLRALNPGASSSSTPVTVTTVPPNPVATPATSITPTGFTANWSTAATATGYLLDVSQASDFSSFVTGFNARPVTVTSESVTGLSNGTTYYYRVKASSTSGASGVSNTISQITTPAAPAGNAVITKGANSFFASWVAVQGAVSYELDVSLFTSNFTTFVAGYHDRPIIGGPPGTNVEDLVTGLSPSTAYSFRVRAVNPGGKSDYSNTRTMITDAAPGGSQQVFSVTLSSFNNGQFSGSSINIQGTASDGVGTITGTLFYRGVTESTFKEKPFTVNNSSYSVPVDDAMLDDLGMEFYVKVRDQTDAEKITNTERIYRTFTTATSPVILNSSFEGTRASIRIIAIPYDLEDNLIESIFSTLGAYDKKGWRLAHYQEGQGNVEYREGVNRIERGQGYWFNAKGSVNIKAGKGSVGTNHQSNAFVLSLVAGWNQIGNPYPFAIDWSDVLADNSTVTGVGALKVYSGSSANYQNGNKMEPYTGGFVHSDNNVSLNIKVSLKATANGGRFSQPGDDLAGKDAWIMPLIVKQGNSVYELGGIGMSPDASASKDSFDDIRLPRMEEYLDITFEHPESRFSHFTRDVIPTAEKGKWTFSVESNADDHRATLEWDPAKFGNNAALLWLLDVEAVRWTDMRQTNGYTFENLGKKEFRIYYSKNGEEILPDVLLVGKPHPNPTAGLTEVNLLLPESGTGYHVNISVFDVLGKPVAKIFDGEKSSGSHAFQWDSMGSDGSRLPGGMYLVRTLVNDQVIAKPTRLIIH